MKNNFKMYKYALVDIINFSISVIITLLIIKFLYYRLNQLYIQDSSILVNKLVSVFMVIKNNIFGDLIYAMIAIIIIAIIYTILSYRRYKKISILVENLEEMASGDLDRKIEIEPKGEIGKVAGNINKIVKRLRNITVEERKAQQTKTDLITNVSHDLRTPLTSIIGYLNLIEEDKYKDEVELRYYTTIAYEKAKNLKVLINDLFELTKLQNKALPINKIDINLVELTSQVISCLDCQLKESNMEVRAHFSEDKLIANVDPDKIVRVLENLINNGINYGREGKYIDIYTNKKGKFAVIEVINYGEPIPVVDLPHIFDRFYRVEKSRNKNNGGSGLGLAITKNIVEAHNGKISVSSDNSRTIFKVILNLKEDIYWKNYYNINKKYLGDLDGR